MASTTLCTISFSGSAVRNSKPTTMYSLLPSCSCSSPLKFPLSSKFSHLGICNFSPWNGLRHVGISVSAKPHRVGSRGKCRGKVVYASLFGVGAPEALVIGVVALLVFGPKGLAEVARNLGKTLRAFQPTIKELQDVSREFKSTLEREISLDDEPDPRPKKDPYEANRLYSTPSSSTSSVEVPQDVPVADQNGTPSSKAYSSEEYLKITEEQLKAAAAAQQDVMSSSPDAQVVTESQPQAQEDIGPSSAENQSESESQSQDTVPETTAAAAPPVQSPENAS